jgi:glucose-1-phosphate thymidylyltransferase
LKGLVLAGGAGSRLRPLTYTGAKQLVPVANRPILFYVLDNLTEAGIADITVVVSPETGAEVRAAVGDGSRWGSGTRIHYVQQDQPAGLAHAVQAARSRLGSDDFCMFLGDNLIGMPIKGAVESFSALPDLSASVMLKHVTDPSQFGVAEVDDDGRVIALQEKPKNPRSNLALVGVYLFRAEIHEAIDRIRPSPRGELEITDAISKLIELGRQVRFDKVDSWWLDTGKKDDLLLANDTVLDAWLVGDIQGEVDSESRVTGRVRIERGAAVVSSLIRGPVVIGAGARIDNATIGPFTSIGPNVTIERSAVERSVLLEGCHVSDVRRLHDSLIGRRVRVSPGQAPAGAISLLVGDDCRVELARS